MNLPLATARCWAEIDLDALCENYDTAKNMLSPGSRVIPVVKANAYGMGDIKICHTLYARGARIFAVAAACEAIALRRALPADAEILLMGMTGDAEMPGVIGHGIILTLFDIDQAARAAYTAREIGKPARAHVKIETGLHRLGFPAETAARDIAVIASDMPEIHIEGMYTHLALRNTENDKRQFIALEAVYADIAAEGMQIPLLHACDSIGMVRYPGKHYGAVRIGAWLYGVCPYRYEHPEQCRPIVGFYARVAQIHAVAAGECAGYDSEHPLARDSRIATISCGYADGYPRLDNAGEVLLRGKRARVVGLVCMDQMMVDVTDIQDAQNGDIVTLIGGGITIDEYAAWGKLNRNEALGRIGRRVPRVYHKNGRIDEIDCQMEE